MGKTAQKLEYLGTTKSQLKDMINYGLDDNNKITNSTTFREYVLSIFNAFLEALRTPDTLFTNLPKKSGTGAVISLNDTANAPMRIELGATDITQAGTPTPSSPQDIHTISGSNKVVVSNSDNTISQEADMDLGYENIAQNAYSNASISLYNAALFIDCNLKPSTKYTLSFKGTIGNKYFTNEYIANQTYITVADGTNSITFTTKSKLDKTDSNQYISSYGCWVILKNNATQSVPNAFSEVMLVEGSTAKPYTPYGKNIEYCKIGNYEDKFIRNSGKQLFKPNFTTTTQSGITFTASDNYSVMVNGTASEVAGFTIALLNVEVGKTYTIGVNTRSKSGVNLLTQKYKDGTYVDILKSFAYDETSYTFTADSTFNQVRFRPTITSGTSVSNEVYYITLCEGTTALEYEPYGSNEWYIKKSVPKIVLDGSDDEGWFFSSSSSSPTDRSVVATSLIHFASTDYVSNRFVINSISSNRLAFVGNELYVSIEDTLTGIVNTDTNAQKLEKIKTWLSSHNLEMYYILATPTYTKITGTLAEQLEYVYQLLKSYKGVTNISQVNNDLPFELDVQAIEDME